MRCWPSPDQFLNHLPMHIGQPAVDAVALQGELGVVEAELVQDGGLDVVDLGGVQAVERFVTPRVAFADWYAALIEELQDAPRPPPPPHQPPRDQTQNVQWPKKRDQHKPPPRLIKPFADTIVMAN